MGITWALESDPQSNLRSAAITVRLWASFLVSLTFVFLIWKMGIIIDVFLEGVCDAPMRVHVRLQGTYEPPEKDSVSAFHVQ